MEAEREKGQRKGDPAGPGRKIRHKKQRFAEVSGGSGGKRDNQPPPIVGLAAGAVLGEPGFGVFNDGDEGEAD